MKIKRWIQPFRSCSRSVGQLCLLLAAAMLLALPSHAQSAGVSVPLMLAPDAERQGFVRIVNESGEAGIVRVTAVDDAGNAADPIELRLAANQSLHFNSDDLADGNPAKGIDRIGRPSQGHWRLAVETALRDVQVMAFVRTRAGFLTAMHDVLPRDAQGRLVAWMLNPGSNMNQQSSLRLVNTGTNSERVNIRGVDDGGRSAGPVTLTLPAGQARTISAFDLENGARGLTGRLGDGVGKWRLLVTAGQSVTGLGLLETAMGPITNISTAGVPAMALTSPPEPLGDDHGNDIASATNLALGGRQSGRIDPAGDKDYFRIQVAESGTLTVYTTSDMDTEGRLFDGSGRRLASNSDGGAVRNFRIEHEVDAGAYYAEVTEWRDDDTGSYTIHAEFDASTGGGGNYGALSIADRNAWGWGVAAGGATQAQADSVANAACEERKVGGATACSIRIRFGSGRCVVLYVARDPTTRAVIGWNATSGPRTRLDDIQATALSNCQARRGGPTCTRLASRCNSGSASGFAPQTPLTVEGSVMIRKNRKR